MFAVVALHVVAASVLLNADVAFRALKEGDKKKQFIHCSVESTWNRKKAPPPYVFGVCRDVVCGLAVVRTLGEPQPDGVTVGGRMVLRAALETGHEIASEATTAINQNHLKKNG